MNDGGDLFVDRSTVSHNHAGGHGGGIYNHSGVIVIDNATIAHNTSVTTGGGIHVGSGSVFIVSSTLLGIDLSPAWGVGYRFAL